MWSGGEMAHDLMHISMTQRCSWGRFNIMMGSYEYHNHKTAVKPAYLCHGDTCTRWFYLKTFTSSRAHVMWAQCFECSHVEPPAYFMHENGVLFLRPGRNVWVFIQRKSSNLDIVGPWDAVWWMDMAIKHAEEKCPFPKEKCSVRL